MLTNRDPKTTAIDRCSVCGDSHLETVVALPDLPLTGIYRREPSPCPAGGIDQQLRICPECGHAQLHSRLNPSVLYGEEYSFRSGASLSARRGIEFFIGFLEELAPGRRWECLLDIGCNDLHMLKRLQGKADKRIGVDPVWASKETPVGNSDIQVWGVAIEEMHLNSVLESPPDMVVCRHTLEHIADPRAVLGLLLGAAAEDALFLFEFPDFETLVRRLRFDQVFHQHLHYFTLSSFRRLLEEAGGTYLAHRENYHDWGSLVVAFTKKDKAVTRDRKERKGGGPPLSPKKIREQYALFRRQLATTNEVMRSLTIPALYGYGAAQMVPVLAYHMGNDFSGMTAILDDDPVKDGMYYSNLPVPIRQAREGMDWGDCAVLVTALDSVVPILGNLLARRPRHILYPFHPF